MRIGLVLLPDFATSAACVRYAHALTAHRAPRMVLDHEARLPHVSLLHVETEAPPTRDEWQAAFVALGRASFTLSILGVAYLPYVTAYNATPAGAGTMAYAIVPCTEALRRAERAAIALPWVRAGQITTANGDAFQPHLTLAIWEGACSAPGTFEFPPEIVGRTGIGARLALGVIGGDGAFVRTIFESDA